jgi:hypothetical protein
MRPLFNRLLFAQDWRGWPDSPISGTVGLMFLRPGAPASLSDVDVTLIMERERAGEFDEIRAAKGSGLVMRTDIVPGDAVVIEVFGRRVLGVLEGLTEEGKAVVGAMLFAGRETRTTVDADAVQKAG